MLGALLCAPHSNMTFPVVAAVHQQAIAAGYLKAARILNPHCLSFDGTPGAGPAQSAPAANTHAAASRDGARLQEPRKPVPEAELSDAEDGDTEASVDTAPPRRPSEDPGQNSLCKDETKALVVFLRRATPPLLSEYCSVTSAALERLTGEGRIRRIHRTVYAKDITYSASREMEHFELILDDDGEVSVRAVRKHRGDARDYAAQIAFPVELRAADAPEILVHLCPPRRVSAILSGGWALKGDAGPLPYYFEFISASAATRTGGAGVAFLARQAISQGIMIMQRSNGTFYTVGRKQRIPDTYATQWPPAHTPVNAPAVRSSPWRRGLTYITESSRRPKLHRRQ